MQFLNDILLIEDDVDSSAAMMDMLAIEGYRPKSAASFEEALTTLGQQQFGVIISDRQLPDGLVEQRLDELRAVAANSPIIVITGYSDMNAVISSFQQGIADYLLKPIIPDDLLRRVHALVDHQTTSVQLQSQRGQNEQFLDTAEAIILVLDFDGRVVRINRFFEELTAWTESDVLGKSWLEFCIFPEDRAWLEKVFRDAVSNGFTRGITNRVRCKDGNGRLIRWSNNKFSDGFGEPRLILSVGIDITEIAEANERAIRSERLAAIGTTVTALAHESRNAIQRIRAAAEVLEFNVKDDVDSLEETTAIQRAASDLSELLESVRDYSAPIRLKIKSTDLQDVWRRAWSDLSEQRSERVVELTEPEDDCDLECSIDRTQFEQLFRNLFLNALEACTDPVQIQITCDCDSRFVKLTLTDNGPGIQKHDEKNVFEPFFTTKTKGTGLGMAICRRIIDAHQGEISIDSNESGASICFQIPRLGIKTVS